MNLTEIMGEMRQLERGLAGQHAMLMRAWREAEGPVLVLRFTARRRERYAVLQSAMVETALASRSSRRPLGACR